MKKQLIKVVMILGLMIVAGAGVAKAQIVGQIKADIPFNFYVGEKLLPAGEYFITEKTPGLMMIRSDDGKSAAFFLTEEKQEKTDPATSELVFNKYGDKAFLSQVVEQGERDSAVLMKSRLEKRIENTEGDVGIVAIALH